VLYSGVACITDLMVKEGLINLDFADVRAVMRGMGKAMMGTGEASGDDRARHAAEAAIANPLLDDVSMHGARGLLISITGGPDLTLYEVDEAASRIREEVDPDCNIILGATYDPDMTGTLRVSVVATGTDATMVQALEPMKANPSRVPLQASVLRQAAAERQPQAQPQPEIEPEPVGELESQVQQAVAEAISHDAEPAYGYNDEDDGIIVEPYIPAAAAPQQLEEAPRLIDAPIPSVYVPGSAERPDGQRRMPRTEELPAVARRSLHEQEKQPEEPRNARALFKRLASNVGLNLRSSEPARQAAPLPSSADDAAARSAIEAGASRNPRVSGAPEGARGNLDPHGRQQPQAQQKEHIEIPAFLRKHG
jgi:cell division protein FtsZ